jgi:hypothetical protein
MSTRMDPDPANPDESAGARRRRIAEVFGDVLPDTTGDERDPESGEGGDGDTWLRAQVPPHHG